MSRTHFHRSVKRPVKLPALFRRSQQAELSLKLIPHAHLLSLTDGRGDEDSFLTIVFRVIVGTTLVCYVDDAGREELEKIFKPAINSLISIGDRASKLGKFGCAGDELLSIKEALNLTDDLQTVSTRRQQAEMCAKVEKFVGGFEYTMRNLKTLQGRYQ